VKILAVDDDELILELLTLILTQAGFTDVSTAVSGETAMEILNKSVDAFDCLLFDVNMPGMDGIELCKLARSMPKYDKTPILMVTAMTQKDYVERAFQAGATDYITKPFDIFALVSRLRLIKDSIGT
jgi:DNA-binding response OmpR family regulator